MNELDIPVAVTEVTRVTNIRITQKDLIFILNRFYSIPDHALVTDTVDDAGSYVINISYETKSKE